jgi:hypothetical protein
MHSLGVPILGVLNQEYHEKGDDSRGGVNDQLPSVGKMKSGASEEPDGNHKHSSSKCPGAAENHGRMARENAERVADEANEIALLFVFLWLFGPILVQRYFRFRARTLDCAQKMAGRLELLQRAGLIFPEG